MATVYNTRSSITVTGDNGDEQINDNSSFALSALALAWVSAKYSTAFLMANYQTCDTSIDKVVT